MAQRQCFTCIHWKQIDDLADYWNGYRPSGYRVCNRKNLNYQTDSVSAEAEPLSLGDDYPCALIMSGPDFGCIHHLTKNNSPS